MKERHALSEEITQRLLYEIREGRYQNCSKLPPEVTLAQELGVSRTLIRDCLSVLEREGFISRKHGVGTIINQHVLDVKIRMDLEKEFLQMVSDAGYKAGMKTLLIEHCEAGVQVAEKLGIQKNDMVFKSVRIVSADGKPAIYCVDYIPDVMVTAETYDIKLLEKPVFEFMDKYCEDEVYMDLSEVKAIGADGTIAQMLKLDVGTPILYIDEVGYTFTGERMLYSQEYYADGIFSQVVLRKKI